MSGKHEAMIRHYYNDIFGAGKMDMAVIDQYLVEQFVAHDLPLDQGGREAYKRFIGMLAASFNRVNPIEIRDMFSCGDKVVARWSYVGTHTAEFMGIPATSRKVTIKGIDIFGLREGKIADLWQEVDIMGILQQVSAPDRDGTS